MPEAVPNSLCEKKVRQYYGSGEQIYLPPLGAYSGAEPAPDLTVREFFEHYSHELHAIRPVADNTWVENTRIFNTAVFPLLEGKSMRKLTEEDYTDAFQTALANPVFSKSTKEALAFLIRFITEAAELLNYCPDVLQDASERRCVEKRMADRKCGADLGKQVARRRIRKSMTPEQEIQFMCSLMKSEASCGQFFGICLMLLCGLRTSEACGATIGSIQEVSPDLWCFMRIYVSDKDSREIRLGGKAKNAYRFVPLPAFFVRLWQKRKEKLQSVYPELSERQINALPLVCVGTNWQSRATQKELNIFAKNLFRQAGIEEEVFLDAREDLAESSDLSAENEDSVSLYLLRRNFASVLESMSFTETELQYLMGHKIEMTGIARSNFSNPDVLRQLQKKLNERPLTLLFDGRLPFVHTARINCQQPISVPADCSLLLDLPETPSGYEIHVTACRPGKRVSIRYKQSELRVMQDCPSAEEQEPADANMRPFLADKYYHSALKLLPGQEALKGMDLVKALLAIPDEKRVFVREISVERFDAITDPVSLPDGAGSADVKACGAPPTTVIPAAGISAADAAVSDGGETASSGIPVTSVAPDSVGSAAEGPSEHAGMPDYYITLTARGYLKRSQLADLRCCTCRPAKGEVGVLPGSGDTLRLAALCREDSENLLLVTADGRLFRVRPADIPSAARRTRGSAADKTLGRETAAGLALFLDGETVCSSVSLLIVTRAGRIKRLCTESLLDRDGCLNAVGPDGLQLLNLNSGDQIAAVLPLREETAVLLCARSGKILQLQLSGVNTVSSLSAWSIVGLRLDADDRLVAAAACAPGQTYLLCLTDGRCKRVDPAAVCLHGRGTGGVSYIPAGSKLAAVCAVSPDGRILLAAVSGQILNIDAAAVPLQKGSTSSGTAVMQLAAGDRLQAVLSLVS